MDGASVALELSQVLPGLTILAWTVSESGEDLLRMFRAGCAGYVLKDSGPDELGRALRAALRGDAPMPRRMLPDVVRHAISRPTPASDVHLTQREMDVLKLLVAGSPRKQMAATLHISVNSVDTHMKSLYRKLGVSSQTEAVNVAFRTGLIDVTEL